MKVKLTEQVELLPQRLGIRKNLNGKRHAYCDFSYYRHSLWNKEIIPKCAKIIESSVGLHVDDVFSKISKIVSKNFPYSNYDVLSFSINYDERKNEGVEIYRNSKQLYINKEGVITRVPPKSYKSYKTDYYRKQWLEERRQQKIRNVVVHKTLLKLINNKMLYNFYVQLIKNEKGIISSISDYHKLTPSTKGRNDFWARYNNQRYANKHKLIAEKEIELQKVRNDISKIEAGEYNIFYESNVYLYSLQKECPHFESPIKQKEHGND